MALLVERRCGELRDADVTRVEPSNQTLDCSAFAGGVPALEQNEDRGSELAADQAPELQAQCQEPFLCRLEPFRLMAARKLQGQVECIKSSHQQILTRPRSL